MYEHQENPLLGFLRTRYRPAGDAFRTNPRHASGARARLSWHVGDRPGHVPGRLLDISRAGAALLTKKPVPGGVLAHLCLTGDGDTPWIEADVLSADPAPSGRYRVRLKFRDPCPTVFLKAAILDAATAPSPVESPEPGEAPAT